MKMNLHTEFEEGGLAQAPGIPLTHETFEDDYCGRAPGWWILPAFVLGVLAWGGIFSILV